MISNAATFNREGLRNCHQSLELQLFAADLRLRLHSFGVTANWNAEVIVRVSKRILDA